MKNLTLILVLISGLFFAACSDFFNSSKSSNSNDNQTQLGEHKPFPSGYNPNEGSFSESKLIANVGLNVIAPATQNMRLQSELLLVALQDWLKSSKNNSNSQTQKESAQNQWKKVMLTYQFLDAAPVGPLSNKDLKLADQIYSWPYSNLCGVDHEVLKLKHDPNLAAPSLFTLKGLAVLEYLLFEETLSTQCNPNNVRNKAVVEWTQKPTLEKERDRINYSILITRDLIDKTRSLESAWDPQTFNFTHSLVDGSLYSSAKDAVNALSDSLFSIEEVKDTKMAKPLGLHKDCLSEEKKCPQMIEHPWSDLSFDAIEAQVSGFYSVFFGETSEVDGFGFDDYLTLMGRLDVSQSMKQNLEHFQTELQQLKQNGSFKQRILEMDASECATSTKQNRKVPVCALYQDLRFVTTKMKTEFLNALSLRAPPTYQGDND